MLPPNNDLAGTACIGAAASASPYLARSNAQTRGALEQTSPIALSPLKREGDLGEEAKLTTGRWLNNQIEQDHQRIKRLVRPGPEFQEFCSTSRTIQVYEAMSMIRKGQVEGVDRGGCETASVLVVTLFGVGV